MNATTVLILALLGTIFVLLIVLLIIVVMGSIDVKSFREPRLNRNLDRCPRCNKKLIPLKGCKDISSDNYAMYACPKCDINYKMFSNNGMLELVEVFGTPIKQEGDDNGNSS